MDNLSSHKGPRVQKMIHARGARLLFLPPYSPDLNPIEGLWTTLGKLLDAFTPTERTNYLAACGYDAV